MEGSFGQDAHYLGCQPNCGFSGEGKTVLDYVTGLTWTRSVDLNDDGEIDVDDNLTFVEFQAYPATLNSASFGGCNDWRRPTIPREAAPRAT